MSLRIQLLVFGLVTLVLPWTAFRYVQEMEAALRGGLEQSLIASASTVAAALEEQTAPLCEPAPCVDDDAPARGTTIYAAPLAPSRASTACATTGASRMTPASR